MPHPNRVALGQARHEQDCALGADVKGAIAVLAVVHPKQVVEESLQWVGQGARKGRAGAYQGHTQASSQRAAEGQYASLGNAGMHRCGAVVAQAGGCGRTSWRKRGSLSVLYRCCPWPPCSGGEAGGGSRAGWRAGAAATEAAAATHLQQHHALVLDGQPAQLPELVQEAIANVVVQLAPRHAAAGRAAAVGAAGGAAAAESAAAGEGAEQAKEMARAAGSDAASCGVDAGRSRQQTRLAEHRDQSPLPHLKLGPRW